MKSMADKTFHGIRPCLNFMQLFFKNKQMLKIRLSIMLQYGSAVIR